MSKLAELLTSDGRIMELRALGYSQTEIAKELNVTQAAISQKLHTIRKRSRVRKNHDIAFWELFMGIGAAHLLEKVFDKSFMEKID